MYVEQNITGIVNIVVGFAVSGIKSILKEMGILGRIEDWMEKRKEEKPVRDLFKKSRKRLSVTDFKCPNCGHHKAFRKKDVLKCTKCKFKSKL